MSKAKSVSIPWYSRSDYREILKLVPPAECDSALSYDNWVLITAQSENQLKRTGCDPVRIPIKPAEVESWCKQQDVVLNRRTIADFAASKMAAQSRAGAS